MYIGFYNNTKQFNKNRMFTNSLLPVGDDLMYPFVYLRQQLKKLGHKVATIDTDDVKKFDAIIFVDFPTFKNKYLKQLIKNNFQNLYLVILESPIIKPDNYDKENHKYFKKIFTWSDELIDNPPSHPLSHKATDRQSKATDGQSKKYFKINYSHKIPKNLEFYSPERKKLCTLISSNKFTHHPQELYTERIKAIRWFENNHPENFDLYGKGWDKYYFYGKFLEFNLSRLNRLKLLAKILGPHYPSWKGEVKLKKETYINYKFAICYENCKDFPGYITEKIFDCFLGGCVPIYLGAPNITNHIPIDCFIDKRNFRTYEDLYQYIKNMPDKEYLAYLNSVNNFLKSDKIYQFTNKYFASTILKEMTN